MLQKKNKHGWKELVRNGYYGETKIVGDWIGRDCKAQTCLERKRRDMLRGEEVEKACIPEHWQGWLPGGDVDTI